MLAQEPPSTSHRLMSPDRLFPAAVNLVFERWQAFKIGTSMGKQSAEIVRMVINATEQCFYDNKDIDSGEELGEWIGDTLNLNFDLRIEDGSLDEVGNQLVNYWRLHQARQFQQLADILDKQAAELPTMNLTPRVEEDKSSEEEDEDEEEKMDTSEPQPGSSQSRSSTNGSKVTPDSSVPDADGWTTVKSKKKK